MNKKLFFLLSIFILLPITVNAKEYTINDDLNITLNDNEWYVFTRNNLSENTELDDIGVSYDYLYTFMQENYAYMDSLLIYDNQDDNIEFFIIVKDAPELNNLHTYSKTDTKKLAEIVADNVNSSNYEIYENDYKYVKLEYKNNGYNILQYYTVINGYGYNFIAQRINLFTPLEKTEIYNIVRSAVFNLDSKYENRKPLNYNDNSIFEKAITAAIATAIIGGISAVFIKKKKMNSNVAINKNNIKSNETDNTQISTEKQRFICDNCGSQIFEKDKYCYNCGLSLKNIDNDKNSKNK